MRRRILLLVVGVTALVVLAFAIPLAVLIRNAVVQREEHAATDQAEAVALFLRDGDPSSTTITSYLASLAQSASRSTSVQLPDGTLLGRQPPQPAPMPALSGNQGPGGYPGGDGGGLNGAPHGPEGPQAQLTKVAGGQVAQVAVASPGSGPYIVSVYVSDAALESGVHGWWALLAGGSVLLVLVGLAGGEVLTRRIVRPLLDTAQTANRITAGDVTARAPATGPREIAEVGSALNRLADRIDELIAEERETIADLSHRLRTPLTALRLDAEALRDADEAERVGAHVSALERTLTAVIRSARRPQREGRLPSADATSVVAERVTFWSALTDEQGRPQQIDLPAASLLVRCSAEDLAAAVDALLENVIAHTPEGTAFSVRLAAADGATLLQVSDDGPGLPSDADVRGRSDRGSSGLGLDIARRCAEASGGSMQIGRAPSGGALITLRLGAP